MIKMNVILISRQTPDEMIGVREKIERRFVPKDRFNISKFFTNHIP